MKNEACESNQFSNEIVGNTNLLKSALISELRYIVSRMLRKINYDMVTCDLAE